MHDARKSPDRRGGKIPRPQRSDDLRDGSKSKWLKLVMNVRGEFLTGEKQLAQVTGVSVVETAKKRAVRLIRILHA
jgi:hypothetical protein